MPEGAIRGRMTMDQIEAWWIRDFLGEDQPEAEAEASTASATATIGAKTPKPNMAKFRYCITYFCLFYC
jgi:hypothetical protein